MQRLPAPDASPMVEHQHLNGFTRFSVDVDGRRMHVMEAGDPNGRPVLMMHGNPTWGFFTAKWLPPWAMRRCASSCRI